MSRLALSRRPHRRSDGGPAPYPHRPLLAIALFAAALAFWPAPAAAQLETFFSPKLGELMPRADYRLTFYPEERVASQPTHLSLFEHRFSLSIPLWQNSANELSISPSVKYTDFDTHARLPDSDERFPHELFDIRLSAAYRHKFENGWIWGAIVTVGTASDVPFHSEDELVVRASTLLRVPHGERNAWIFMLNYSNRDDLFGLNVPIPGLAYLYSPSDRFTAVIGLPFSSVEYKPWEDLTLEASYQAVRTVRVRATYRPFRPLRLYAGFDWDNWFWLLADRGDKDDKFSYYEKRWTGGIRFDLRHVGFEVSGGWAFDRFYFIGEGYSDRRENRVDVRDGPFVVGRIQLRF